MADSKVIDGLNGLLADSTVFYQKLRHYHWNVEGRHFFELHAKFEELYTKWATHIDDVAERILTLDATPLHTLKGMLGGASLKEDESIPAAPKMVDAILNDLDAMHKAAAGVIAAAEDADDRGTANLLDDLSDGIEMDMWMLRAWKKQTGN